MTKNWLSVLLIGILVAGCHSPTVEPTVTTPAVSATPPHLPAPTITLSPTPTLLPHPTLTPTPEPTSTPEPTFTPAATHTPRPGSARTSTLTPVVSKQAIVLYYIFGGDGGSTVQYYLGDGMPMMVLYQDGQLIMWRNQTTMEKTLSPAELAAFLDRIRETGFLDVVGRGTLIGQDSIYDFPPGFKMQDSIGGVHLEVNLDNASKWIPIEAQYLEYLIPEIKEAYAVITGYAPDGMQPFRPRQAVMWIEPLDADAWYTPDTPAQPWPADLPPISELGMGHIIVADELLPRLLELFEKIPSAQIFQEGEAEYLVILRPLLPNESPSTNWDN